MRHVLSALNFVMCIKPRSRKRIWRRSNLDDRCLNGVDQARNYMVPGACGKRAEVQTDCHRRIKTDSSEGGNAACASHTDRQHTAANEVACLHVGWV
jgi:hypothetical protein